MQQSPTGLILPFEAVVLCHKTMEYLVLSASRFAVLLTEYYSTNSFHRLHKLCCGSRNMSFVDKAPFVSSIVYADSWLLDWLSQYTLHRVDSLGSQAYKHHRSESCCKSKQMNGLIWLPAPQSISLSSDLESKSSPRFKSRGWKA